MRQKTLTNTLFKIIGASILTIFSGCASLEEKPSSPPILIKQSIRFMKVKNYNEALETVNKLLEDFPDSKERAMALVIRAEAHYRLAEFQESKFHFQQFLEQYPAHKLSSRAQYLKAMSDFHQMDISSRDQTFTKNALEEFDKLIEGYPKSRFLEKAQEKRKICIEHLALKEMEIARFYFRTSSYHAAISRIKELLDKYPEQKFLDEAVFLLGESYFKEQNLENAKVYYQQLLKNFPKSLFVKEARARLKKIKL